MASTDTTRMKVGGLSVDIVRKDIKNLHLGVYPPNGRIRVAAPLGTSDEAIRLAVIGKTAWIRRQRAKLADQPRQTMREAVSGESHYFLGRRYRLSIEPTDGRPRVQLRTKTRIDLLIDPDSTGEQRMRVLERWYRDQLRQVVDPMIGDWSDTLGVSVAFAGIKRMKTKWGSCNPQERRIWINSELAKKSISCIEYIVVHELIHLIEPLHNDRFVALMDQHLADWRTRRAELNRSPLAHESWTY